MPLYLKDGKLLVKGGALGTGQACCCNKCSGPCDGENPCPPGCVCVDGECQESPCSGPCDSSCFAAYCCSGDGQCGPNGDGCAEFLGCAERWNSPAYFATSAEAQAFADEFNANNPNTSPNCGMIVVVEIQNCPENVQASPCPEGCACVDGQCVVPCSVSGCPDPATPCCGEGYVNPNDPESFPSPECWGPPPFVVYFCEGFGFFFGTPEEGSAACEAECETECVFVQAVCGGL